MNSVMRIKETSYNGTNLEYSIDSHQIDFIVSNAHVNAVNKETKAFSPNTLLAFITTDEYSDHQNNLEEKFNVKKCFFMKNLMSIIIKSSIINLLLKMPIKTYFQFIFHYQ